MRPGVGAGEERGGAGGGEIAGGVVVVEDGGAGCQALQVGAGLARVAIEREVAGGEGIEQDDDQVGRRGAWRGKAGEGSGKMRSKGESARVEESFRKSRRVRVISKTDDIAQQNDQQTQDAEREVDIDEDAHALDQSGDQAAQSAGSA